MRIPLLDTPRPLLRPLHRPLIHPPLHIPPRLLTPHINRRDNPIPLQTQRETR